MASWVSLRDCIESLLCKPVPRPERAVLSSSIATASRWQQFTTYGKRHKISEEAEDQYNPKRMNDKLFTQLKITILSLPSYLRLARILASVVGLLVVDSETS